MALPPFEIAYIARKREAEILKFGPPVALEDAKRVECDALHAAGVDVAKNEAWRIVLTGIFPVDSNLAIEPQTIFQASMLCRVGYRFAHRLLGNIGVDVNSNLAVSGRLSLVAPARDDAGNGPVSETRGGDANIDSGKAKRLFEVGISEDGGAAITSQPFRKGGLENPAGTAIWSSPGNRAPVPIEILQPRFPALRDKHVDQFRDCLFHRDGRIGSSKIGSNPPWSHEKHCSWPTPLPSGKAAHEHVQSRLATAVEFPRSFLIVSDASLPRGHHTDQSVGWNEVLQRFDYSHGTERIRCHDPHKLVIRDSADALKTVGILCRRASIHEQHVE